MKLLIIIIIAVAALTACDQQPRQQLQPQVISTPNGSGGTNTTVIMPAQQPQYDSNGNLLTGVMAGALLMNSLNRPAYAPPPTTIIRETVIIREVQKPMVAPQKPAAFQHAAPSVSKPIKVTVSTPHKSSVTPSTFKGSSGRR